MDSDYKKPYRVKANHLLRAKVGYSKGVDPKKVAKSQKVIENNQVDFVPMALGYLDEFDTAVTAARQASDQKPDNSDMLSLIAPIMQLKANGKMFKFSLVSTLANIMLDFLEAVDEIDNDVLEIAAAHHRTLVHIIKHDLRSDDTPEAKEFITELRQACKRYFARQASRH